MSEYCDIYGDDYVETYLGCTICYTTRIVGGMYYSDCVEVYHSDILDAKKDICEQQDGVWDGATCDLEITPYWKYNTTYRGIDIEVWYPYGTPYRAWFNDKWNEESTRPLLKAAIDAYLGPEPGPFTSIIDFVVPDYLPAGSPVSVSVLLKNTGGTAGRLDVNIIGNPSEEEEYTQVGAGTALSVQPGASVWRDVTCFNMPDWDYHLSAENQDNTSRISKTISLGAAPPLASAYIYDVPYWISGMPAWGSLWSDPTGPVPVAPPNYSDRPAEAGETITLAVTWFNTGTVAITGHVDLELTTPYGEKYILTASSGQDETEGPSSGQMVVFSGVSLDEAGIWSLKATLSHADGTLDEETTSFTVGVPLAADFGFVSVTTVEPSYDAGEAVWVAFVAGNVGGGSGVFTVEFYDDDTGALLASFEGPLSVPPGGESDPFAINVGAMPDKDWMIRCEITP